MNQIETEVDVYELERRRQEKARQVQLVTPICGRAEFDLSHLKAKPESEALRNARRENERQSKVQELRLRWNAPIRQASRATLDREGEWGQREQKLLSLLGSGFIVVLVGVRGCGKTQLAVEMMRETTNRLRSAWFRSAADFFLDIKATFRRDSTEDERDVLRRYGRFDLLVLDEAGQRSESEWENRLLFDLLNKRYEAQKDTLLISNQTLDQFRPAMGDSILSRINECGGIMECNWRSYRE